MGFEHLRPKSYSASVDENIGESGTEQNIAFLRSTLLSAWSDIKSKKLTMTNEPVVPALHRRPLPKLGASTQQRDDLESDQLRSADELHAAADEYQARPRARAVAIAHGARRRSLPEISSLLDREIEVMWEMEYNRRDGGVYKTNQWCAGTIRGISDANTVDMTAAKRKKLGMGWLWIEYKDGTGGWLLATRPTFYKANKPGGWHLVKRDGEMDDSDDEVAGDEEDDEECSVDEEELVDADDDDDDDDGMSDA